MKKLYNKRCVGIILSSVVLVGTVLGHFAYDSFKVSADSKVYERLQAIRNETEGVSNKESSSNSNEVLLIIKLCLKQDI